MALDFSGRTALVVGEDGPLTAAIAQRLREQGADARRGADGTALVRDAMNERGRVDILVLANDAPAEGTLLTLTGEESSDIFNRQLKGAIDTVRAALPLMREADYGRIVACVPSTGMFGTDRGVAQCIAAAGVIALARSLGISNLDRDIRSNIVSYVAATPASEGLFAQHPLLQRELFKIDAILPAITYLAHEACKLTGDAISAGAGRYARMFTSITLGGFDPDIGDDAFESLLPKVMDARSTFAPRTAVDELITIAV